MKSNLNLFGPFKLDFNRGRTIWFNNYTMCVAIHGWSTIQERYGLI